MNKSIALVHGANIGSNQVSINENGLSIKNKMGEQIIKSRVSALLKANSIFNFQNIVFGSGASKNTKGESEAVIAYNYYKNLLGKTVERNIYLDEKSMNTKDEIEYTIDLALKDNIDNIILISSPWHIQRCMTTAYQLLKEKGLENKIHIIGYNCDDFEHELPTIIEMPHIPEKIGYNISSFMKSIISLMIQSPEDFVMFLNELKLLLEKYNIKVIGESKLWEKK